MTSELDSRSAGDRARSRAYHLDFWPGIVGYVVVLTAVTIFGDLDGAGPWRFVWALLPVLPALWVIRAVVRHVRRIDDYQRGARDAAARSLSRRSSRRPAAASSRILSPLAHPRPCAGHR